MRSASDVGGTGCEPVANSLWTLERLREGVGGGGGASEAFVNMTSSCLAMTVENHANNMSIPSERVEKGFIYP